MSATVSLARLIFKPKETVSYWTWKDSTQFSDDSSSIVLPLLHSHKATRISGPIFYLVISFWQFEEILLKKKYYKVLWLQNLK